MAALVTLQKAKLHLNETSDARDEDIAFKAEQASDIIVDYLKTDEAAAYTIDTVPKPVQAAVLLMLTHLVESRGEDMDRDEHLWNAIERLLMRFRDPALA